MGNSTLDVSLTLALDAMGGDNAPHAVLYGAKRVLQKYPHVRFLLFGDESQIAPYLSALPELAKASEVMHTDSVISSEEKPSVALRKGRKSSMRLAIDAVANGKAHAVVSSGNTGALMAMSKIGLRMLRGIDRPAIVSLIPTSRGRSVMLDLGANVQCSAENLFQFAVMGDAFARGVLNIENPTLGILNIGSEDLKGNESVKSAAEMLRETHLPLNFYGFVEGDDLASGIVDVVVTDGFTGNVALKTAEGTAKICKYFLKESFSGSLLGMIGGFFAKTALKKAFKKIDPRLYNGAMFIGVDGIAVKSHGGADELAFASALEVAIELAAHKVNDRITAEMEQFHEQESMEADRVADV